MIVRRCLRVNEVEVNRFTLHLTGLGDDAVVFGFRRRALAHEGILIEHISGFIVHQRRAIGVRSRNINQRDAWPCGSTGSGELYAMWTWIGVFLQDSFARSMPSGSSVF